MRIKITDTKKGFFWGGTRIMQLIMGPVLADERPQSKLHGEGTTFIQHKHGHRDYKTDSAYISNMLLNQKCPADTVFGIHFKQTIFLNNFV